jgi:hypothetical protein
VDKVEGEMGKRTSTEWGEGEVVVEPVCMEVRPTSGKRIEKGFTKYPWAEVPIGGALKIRRALGTVKQACQRWCREHRPTKFTIWRSGDGWVIAKRVK